MGRSLRALVDCPIVITKPRIIGLVAILVVGFLILRCGDESPDSGSREDDPGVATDRRPHPRAPTHPTPSYGPGAPSSPPPYGERRPYPEQASPGTDQGGYETSNPYGEQARIRPDGYRFRSLPEQQQGHRQTPDPDPRPSRYTRPYGPPLQSSPSWEQPQPTMLTPYPAPPAQAEIYNFRPLKKSPGARGRWQGPYGQPGQPFDRSPTDPWSPSSHSQWGSTPPPQRMYPSFYQPLAVG